MPRWQPKSDTRISKVTHAHPFSSKGDESRQYPPRFVPANLSVNGLNSIVNGGFRRFAVSGRFPDCAASDSSNSISDVLRYLGAPHNEFTACGRVLPITYAFGYQPPTVRHPPLSIHTVSVPHRSHWQAHFLVKSLSFISSKGYRPTFAHSQHGK